MALQLLLIATLSVVLGGSWAQQGRNKDAPEIIFCSFYLLNNDWPTALCVGVCRWWFDMVVVMVLCAFFFFYKMKSFLDVLPEASLRMILWPGNQLDLAGLNEWAHGNCKKGTCVIVFQREAYASRQTHSHVGNASRSLVPADGAPMKWVESLKLPPKYFNAWMKNDPEIFKWVQSRSLLCGLQGSVVWLHTNSWQSSSCAQTIPASTDVLYRNVKEQRNGEWRE